MEARPLGKAHFWPLATQDLRTSHIRNRAQRLGNRDLWFLYQELLTVLHEQTDGTLPADPHALADEVDFFTPEQIRDLLPLLVPAEGKRGGIVVEGGRCWNPRLREHIQERQGYLQAAAADGALGGKARMEGAQRDARGRLLPKASPGESNGSAKGSPGPDQGASSLSVSVSTSNVDGGSTPDVRGSVAVDEKTHLSGPAGPDRRVWAAQAQEVFAYWQRVLEHPTAKFTQDRRRKVEARLREDYTVAQLCRAVDGCKVTPHNMGENDTGQRWDDLALICRSGSNVERFMDAAPERPADPAQRKREADEKAAALKAAVNKALDGYEAQGYDRAALRKHALDAHARREDPLEIMERAARNMTPKRGGGEGGQSGAAAAV